MDLSESMKIALSKDPSPSAQRGAGAGYVTEKLYMLLQLYLQNKGWNPSVELLQCFSELKDSPVLPSPAYLQVIANRVNLDSQGRLILRENGKIVLPYEHFGNAVMLKHMQGGPHGIHLSMEQTVRAVMESYTIGRENFGMEKEFIIDVVKSCPNCRYYKQQMTWAEQSGFPNQMNPDYLTHLQQMAAAGIDISAMDGAAAQNLSNASKKNSVSSNGGGRGIDPQQAQITAAIIQQQNRAMAQQALDKNFVNMFPMEKQKLLQQYQREQQHLAAAAAASAPSTSVHPSPSTSYSQQQQQPSLQQTQQQVPPPPPPQTPLPSPIMAPPTPNSIDSNKDIYRTTFETLDAISSSNKDLLALHNGAWSGSSPVTDVAGQEKIVRAFTELMRNMARMKQFIRPSMCECNMSNVFSFQIQKLIFFY